MIQRSPSYLDRFHCSAGNCPDSCCGYWEVILDAETLGKYIQLGGNIGAKIMESLRVNEDGETCIAFYGRKCALLTEEGLCDIQLHFGEASLCDVCRRYPRFRYEFGGSAENGVSISCPEACQLILNSDFSIVSASDHLPPAPNDIDAELYFGLLSGRTAVFNFLKNSPASIAQKCIAILRYADKLERTPSMASDLPFDFFLPVYGSNTIKCRDLTAFLSVFLSMEYLEEALPATIADMKTVFLPSSSKEAERLLSYYLYKYFLQAAYDGHLLNKVLFSIASTIMILSLSHSHSDDGVLWKTAYRFSRETEHSEENLFLFAKKVGRRQLPLYQRVLSFLDNQ